MPCPIAGTVIGITGLYAGLGFELKSSQQHADTISQVLRWSALAAGLFYGFSHQRTIYATQKADHSKHEYEKKQKLIEQAKAEYAKQKNPAPASADNGASCGITWSPASMPT